MLDIGECIFTHWTESSERYSHLQTTDRVNEGINLSQRVSGVNGTQNSLSLQNTETPWLLWADVFSLFAHESLFREATKKKNTKRIWLYQSGA